MTHADFEKVPAGACQVMVDIRREIDRVDRALVSLLAERLTYIERAAAIKSDRGKVHDDARIKDVLTKVRTEAGKLGSDPDLAEGVWRELIRLCITHEFTIFDCRNGFEKIPENTDIS